MKALLAPGCGTFSRKELDDLTKFAARYRAKGLAWMIVEEEGIRSPLTKFLQNQSCKRFARRPKHKRVICFSLWQTRKKLSRMH